MSLATIDTILERIAAAEPGSPLAVFDASDPYRLNCVFANTVLSRSRIRKRRSGLVGVYDKLMDRNTIRMQLKKALAGRTQRKPRTQIHAKGWGAWLDS